MRYINLRLTYLLNYLNLQTQFGEDRCTQFRVIIVTDTQTHKQTHRQDRLQYTASLSLVHSVTSPGWSISDDAITVLYVA